MSGKKVLRLDLRKLKKNYTITLNLAIIMGDLGYTPLSSQLAMWTFNFGHNGNIVHKVCQNPFLHKKVRLPVNLYVSLKTI